MNSANGIAIRKGTITSRPLSSGIRETHNGLLAMDSHHTLFCTH